MVKITKSKIQKIEKLDKELEKLKQEASDKLKQAKQNKEQELEIERDGKKVKIKEGDLWVEVFKLGANCEAGKALETKYPEVFKAYRDQDDKAKESREYFLKEFGFPFSQITQARLLKLVEKMVEYILNKGA